jgi:GDP-L-fucose synthase
VGREITIAELSALIAELVGFGGEIVWDRTKPDGQPRRWLDTSRAERDFQFRAETDLREGLERSIAWYRSFRGEKSLNARAAASDRA